MKEQKEKIKAWSDTLWAIAGAVTLLFTGYFIGSYISHPLINASNVNISIGNTHNSINITNNLSRPLISQPAYNNTMVITYNSISTNGHCFYQDFTYGQSVGGNINLCGLENESFTITNDSTCSVMEFNTINNTGVSLELCKRNS